MIVRCGNTTRHAMNNVNCIHQKHKTIYCIVSTRITIYILVWSKRSYQKRESQESPYRPQSKGEPAFNNTFSDSKLPGGRS